MTEPAPRADMSPTPLAVDLDGTLTRTDTLYEAIAAALFKRPLATLLAVPQLLRGRAPFKRRIAAITPLDVDSLPLNEELVAHLAAERDAGRALHLVTAADDAIAQALAERTGLFDSAQGSDGARNLKGAAKRDHLCERFPGGFAYAGDSAADMPVWRAAKGVVVVAAKPGVAAKAKALGQPVEAEFPRPKNGGLRTWRRAFRLHQWSKNLLMFAPLLLGHGFTDPANVLVVIAGFVIMGVVASGTYIVNDLADLSADRRHRTKHARPLASGAMPARDGLIAAALMIPAGLVAAFALAPLFGVLVGVYLATTLSYSLRLKRVVLLDAFILGALYTMRIAMGVAIVPAMAPPSPWLFTFSGFLFFSLALAKRHVEAYAALQAGRSGIPDRGYHPEDAPLTLALGVATATASVLILVLYLTEEAFPSGVYAMPQWLWTAPVVLSLWTSRVWLLAHRGELHDDPVEFAVRDRVSLALGCVLIAAFGFAVVM